MYMYIIHVHVHNTCTLFCTLYMYMYVCCDSELQIMGVLPEIKCTTRVHVHAYNVSRPFYGLKVCICIELLLQYIDVAYQGSMY